VHLEADGAALLGVTVDGSGGRFDLMDAAVRVEANDVRVEGVRVVGALFGILVEKSSRVVLRRNEIVGHPDQPLGMRGDGIRLWEVRDSHVDENVVRDSRDLVVWYAPGNRFTGNIVERGRYGTHFMYSHGNRVEGNRYRGNVVGIFVMYSHDIEIRRNLLAASRGAAGVGLGTKESGNLRVAGNAFVDNTVGLYLDTSPLYLDHANHFEGNLFQFSDSAVVFHGSERRNTLEGNDFRSNHAHLRIEGQSRGEGVTWARNYFDDYAGYDLDGDGNGDIAYQLRSLEANLTRRYPVLAFFRGSPVMDLIEVAGRLIPLFDTRILLIDPTPRMRAADWREPRAG
jgi:nitrous oxidase accessory protein